MRCEIPDIRPAGRYTTAKAAELLGVDRHTIRRWHDRGELRAGATNGRRRYYKGSDLIRCWNTH